MGVAQVRSEEISSFLALDEDDGPSFANLLQLFFEHSALGRLGHFEEILVDIRVGTANSSSSHEHVVVRHLLGKFLNLDRKSGREQ